MTPTIRNSKFSNISTTLASHSLTISFSFKDVNKQLRAVMFSPTDIEQEFSARSVFSSGKGVGGWLCYFQGLTVYHTFEFLV